MNHVCEEHRIRLFSSGVYRDSFTGLWTYIAHQQHFLKLTLSALTGDRSIKEEIEHAVRQRDGSSSPYSSQIFQTYHIVYQKGPTVIVTNQPTSALGTFFAVEDTDCPHRYFIAFAFSVGGMSESITGFLVYFNERGHCYSDRTIICRHVLTTYDMRNGLIREGQMFLYHQSLLFTQIHRDTRTLILSLNYIPYDTEAIDDHISYNTSYIVSHHCAVWGESITLFKRFLHIPLSDSAILFDLGSLERVEERAGIGSLERVEERAGHDMDTLQRYFILQSYHLSKKDHMIPFLEIAALLPEKEYSDGYPIHCIKCYKKTVAARYGYKHSSYSSTHTGLGNSYCPECHIRYSHSKREWLCAEIRLDGTICDGYLLETGCRTAPLHSSDQTSLLLYDTPCLKYPYRPLIRIQWTPSEDAVECAQASRFITQSDLYATETPPKAEDEVI